MTGALDDFSLLVTLKTPDDLHQRSRYHSKLNPAQSQLAEVLAPYHFDERYPCGLSSCRTPHQHGYLVITVDGKETNIGGDCGENIFGKDFVIKANLQKQRAQFKYQVELLQELRSQKSVLLSRIADLLNRQTGVKWAESTLKSFKDAVGHSTFTLLREKARRGETSVEKARVATEEERDRYQVSNRTGRPLEFVSERIGDLAGLAFLNQNPERVLVDLKNRLYELDTIDVKALTPRQRNQWVNWAGGIERTFSEVEEALAESLRFFTQENFVLLPFLSSNAKEQARLSQIRWSISERRVVVKRMP